MSQDFKCAVGMHTYEVLETKDIKNPYGILVGNIIISRCSHCGKIKVKSVYTDTFHMR